MKPETYEYFLGIDNVNDTTQIVKRPATAIGGRGKTLIRLIQAENVDLHNDSHLSRCNGYSLSLSGSYKSVWSNDKICLAVLGGNLMEISPDVSASLLLRNVGTNEMSYETVSDGTFFVVYFTNGYVIGKVKNGVASLLPSTTKEFKAPLPPGNIIKFFDNSLYVVNKKVVYISDVLNKEIFDRRWGFKLFESDITMFEAVKEGIYVSDSDCVYFMKRVGTTEEVLAAPKFTLEKLFNQPAIPGTAVSLFDVTAPSGASMLNAIVWVSGNTLCIGGEDGKFETIRKDVYSVPSSRKGTGVFRVSGDLRQYITITQ